MTRDQTDQGTSRLQVGDLTLDRATFELSSSVGTFRLTNKEFQVLEMLMCNPRQLISTERFLEKIWGYDNDTEINVVWVYLSYLRKKAGRPAEQRADQGQAERRVLSGGGPVIRKLRVRLVAAAMLSPGGGADGDLRGDPGFQLSGAPFGHRPYSDAAGGKPREFPKLEADFDWENRGPRHHSPELGYETRYFSVLLDENGQAVEANTGKIAAVDEAAAAEYAQAVWAQGTSGAFSGTIATGRFQKGRTPG